MQNWHDSTHQGTDGHSSWASDLDFSTDQDDHFTQAQPWPHSVNDPTHSFSHLTDNPESHAANFFAVSEAGQYLDDISTNLQAHGATGQEVFHGHGSTMGHNHQPISLNQINSSQPYGSAQTVIDPSFQHVQDSLYGEPTKLDSSAATGTQPHGHPQSQAETFAQHGYAFTPAHEQGYHARLPQYSQSQIASQNMSQTSHAPLQHFEKSPSSQQFSSAGQRMGSPMAQPSIQSHPGYSQNPSYAARSNRRPPDYQTEQQYHFQTTPQPHQPQQQHNQRQPASQSPFPSSQFIQPQSSAGHLQHSLSPAPIGATKSLPAHIEPSTAAFQDAQSLGEPAAKRKRMSKGVVDTMSPGSFASNFDTLPDKRVEDVDKLPHPVPRDEDRRKMAQFAKRGKAVLSRFPAAKSLPHFVSNDTVKLPTPKSYDKLAPMVASPSRSGKPVVADMGYDLPAAIQGRFTTRYQPSPHNGGLEKRKLEAKSLLDNFEKEMKALGKRRPKYTEYPHAFKEQLKSDEASKNKAEKKARQEQTGEQGDERAKPIRPPVRPLDPAEAAAWDMIGFVTIDKGIERSGSLIASRVQQAGDHLISLRTEMNRAKLSVDQAVKDNDAELPQLKQKYEAKKNMLYKALDATVMQSDDAVLDNLGGHQKLILSLVNVLISCVKAGDFSGPLPKIVLELFTHFRVTKKMAETTNFDTVRKRFADKGDAEVKEMISEISANVKKVLDAAKPDTATGYTGTSAASRARAAATSRSADGTSTKRSRDEDGDSRAVKKIAVESGTNTLGKKLGQSKSTTTSATKLNAGKTGPSILSGKSRTTSKAIPKTLETTKPDTASSDDKVKLDAKKSASKVESAKPSAAETKTPTPKASSGTSTSGALSGIASLLDSINAPKAEAAAAAAAAAASSSDKHSDSNETPQQLAKRLRKETRRKLRVSWKPEQELVQIKIFHKDDEEDEGRENNMIRDAADDHAEGMVLKQRANVEDEDEDDDIPYQPWIDPVLLDLSPLPNETKSKNYTTRGGTLSFSTPEQKYIEERSQRELMTIYTDVADIPFSPKSPLPDATAIDEERKVAQLPEEGAQYREIRSRWLDSQSLGTEGALLAAHARLGHRDVAASKLSSFLGKMQSPASSQSTNASSSPTELAPLHDLPLIVGAEAEEKLLAWLRSDKAQTWQDPSPVQGYNTGQPANRDQVVQAAADLIESIAAQYRNKPFPAATPPDWLLPYEDKVQEWWFGYHKDMSARQKKASEAQARAEAEANALKAVMSGNQDQSNGQAADWAAYYQQQQAYGPYMAILQQMQSGGTQQSQASQLQSLVGASGPLGQTQSGPPSQSPNPAANLHPNDPTYQQLLMLSQMTQGGAIQPPSASSGSQGAQYGESTGDRGSGWDSDRRAAADDYHSDHYNKDGTRKKKTLAPHKPANKALIGTKACTFWQQGKCARGDMCTFRHD